MTKTDYQQTVEGICFSLMVEQVRDYAIFLTDPGGTITSWNAAACQMKGYLPEEAIGSHLSMLYTDEDVLRGAPEHNLRIAAENGTFQEEAWRKKKDGTHFWAMVELIALRDSSDALIGFCKITRDQSEVHELQERLQLERARAEATLQAIHEGVISVRSDDQVDYLNPQAEKLTGWSRSQLRHATLQDVVKEVPPEHWSAADTELLSPACSPNTKNIEARDGHHSIVEVTNSVIMDEAGEPQGAVVVLRDVEPQLSAELHVREAETRKDEFLAMLAHELRNPLAPVSAAAELLGSGKLDDRGVRKSSQVISRQIAHMTVLVDDLLDVSRITRGLVILDKAPLNMKTLVADALEQARPIIEAKRHALKVSLPHESANVSGDPVRLTQVLVNLLNNAAKYTRPGGAIKICVKVTDQLVTCSVSDNGIGVDPDMLPRVFDLFEQAQRSSDRAQGGLGIGLALVKKIMELHGGSVSCESVLGEGSTFTVGLARLNEAEGIPERRTTKRGIVLATQVLTILVVDDNVDGAEMLAALLELEGHVVTTAHAPDAALALTREQQFDVCILDIGLPGMSGYELCERILDASGEGARPKLIALTGFAQDADKQAANQAGFSHYLVKPVDLGALNSALVPAA
jgi:PAS domain S-box-containing protein